MIYTKLSFIKSNNFLFIFLSPLESLLIEIHGSLEVSRLHLDGTLADREEAGKN